MDLKNFIDRGVEISGGQKQLGEILSVSSQQLTDAKRGRAGLPPAACGLLAEIIGEDETVILAASELLTEKNPRRRAYWEKKLERLAAMVLLGVISVVTPTPSQAAPLQQVVDSTLYIMSNAWRVCCSKWQRLLQAFLMRCPPPRGGILVARVDHMTTQ